MTSTRSSSSSSSGTDCSRIFLIVANIIFLTIGIGMVVHAVYDVMTYTTELSDIPTEHKRHVSKSGTNEIVSGCSSIVVGFTGLLAATLRNQNLSLVYGILLILAVMVNVVSLIMMTATEHDFHAVNLSNVNEVRSSIVAYYGSNDTAHSEKFTDSINAHQRNFSCCGWSLSGKSNIFENTPWFRLVNQVKNGSWGSPLTHPESCCTSAWAMSDECVRARSTPEARKSGFIHPKDCFERPRRTSGMRYVRILQYIVLIALQAACMFFLVKQLIRDPPPLLVQSSSVSWKEDGVTKKKSRAPVETRDSKK